MRALYRWRHVYLGALMLLLTGLVAGYWFLEGRIPEYHRDKAYNAGSEGAPGNLVAERKAGATARAGVRIGPETRIIYRRVYQECGFEERETKSPSREMMGLDMEGLHRLYPAWVITRFDKSAVELVSTVPGFCPEMTKYRFIGLKDGKVAVFYGKPGPHTMVKQITNIEAGWLHESDRRRLEQGIVIEAQQEEEDAWKILEGLAE